MRGNLDFALVHQKLTKAIYSATAALPFSKAKKIDWLCTRADAHIASPGTSGE